MSIKIKQFQPSPDKTALSEWAKEELLISLAMHKSDVQKGCAFIANKIIEAGINHDYTKISLFDDFMEDNVNLDDFKSGKWYQAHLNQERHHLNKKCPDDVNLIDIIEMLVDCTATIIARKGVMRVGLTAGDFISDEILSKAFINTVEMLKNEIILEE